MTLPCSPELVATIAATTDRFTGRQWVFGAIDEWLGGGAGPRALVITGGPGTGKTALSARICQMSAGAAPPAGARLGCGSVSFAHFCQARRDALIAPLRFIESLSGRLAHIHPRFAEALLELRDPEIKIVQTIGTIASGATANAIVIEALHVGNLAPRVAFDRLVRRPLEKLFASGHTAPLVLLIDALDEAWSYDPEDNIVTLLVDTLDDPGDLPPNVRLVLTSRPDPRVVDALMGALSSEGARFLDLIRDAPNSVDDVRDYASARLQAMPEPGRGRLAERIAKEHEQGNFLYARYVLDELVPLVSAGTDPMAWPLPKGLRDIYRRFLDRELRRAGKEQDWKVLHRPLLGALAVARGSGLTREQLGGIVGHEGSWIDDFVEAGGQYLAGKRPAGPFRLFHQSFRDFLIEEQGRYQIYAPEAEEKVAAYFCSKYRGAWVGCHDEYALRHTVTHLLQAARSAEHGAQIRSTLTEIVTDPAWIERKATVCGVDLVLQDLRSVAGLLAPTGGPDHARIAAHVDVIEREAHVLRDWRPEQSPAFFAQQAQNRAIDMGLEEVARGWKARLGAAQRAHVDLVWRAAAENAAMIRVFEGHKDWVTGVAILSSGRRAVSVSADRTVRVWDLDSGERLDSILVEGDSCMGLALSPDDRQALILGGGPGLALVDLRERVVRRVGASIKGVPTAAAFAPGGRRAAVATELGPISVLDLRTDTVERELPGHTLPAQAIAVMRDGTILSASADGTLKLWNIDTGEGIETLQGHRDSVLALSVTPDGARAVSVSSDRKLIVWDLRARRLLREIDVARPVLREQGADKADLSARARLGLTVRPAPMDLITTVTIAPDGRCAATGSDDMTIKIWDLENGNRLTTYVGHENRVRAVAIAPDGKRVLSGSDDGSLRLWDMRARERDHGLKGHGGKVFALRMTPEADLLVSASRDRTLRVWDVEQGKLVHVLEGHERELRALAVTRDGRAVSGATDRTLRVWDIRSGALLCLFPGHAQRVLGVDISEDGQRCVSCSEDGGVHVWDLSARRQEAKFNSDWQTYAGPTLAVAITPDGSHALASSEDGRLRLWDLRQRKLVWALEGHQDRIYQIRFLARGLRAISSSWDQTVKLWNVEDGELLWTSSERQGARIWALAVTPDEGRALSGGQDGSLKLWSLTDGALLASMGGHKGMIHDLCVDPSGRTAASGGEDRVLRIWRLDRASEMASVRLDGEVTRIRYVPDGARLFAGDAIGNVYCLRFVDPSCSEAESKSHDAQALH